LPVGLFCRTRRIEITVAREATRLAGELVGLSAD
jgi:hypothetical protein